MMRTTVKLWWLQNYYVALFCWLLGSKFYTKNGQVLASFTYLNITSAKSESIAEQLYQKEPKIKSNQFQEKKSINSILNVFFLSIVFNCAVGILSSRNDNFWLSKILSYPWNYLQNSIFSVFGCETRETHFGQFGHQLTGSFGVTFE